MQVGLVGWRGMVGSVLMQRMNVEKDFDKITPAFFSTSQVGQLAVPLDGAEVVLRDANSLSQLSEMDVIISCQGGNYTKQVHGPLRESGWSGYWIDAASTLRMSLDSIIILDPINGGDIDVALGNGKKDFIGGNCTTSLMMLAMHGLFREGLVDWISTMTYQAASGAGAQNMRELIQQMGSIYDAAENELALSSGQILNIDALVLDRMRAQEFPTEHFGVPLAGSLIPWIDSDLGNGQSREEWKAQAEANKILNREENPIPIEGICVRVGAMRCHSQALTFKLSKSILESEIEMILEQANDWVSVVPNQKAHTISMLSPTNVTRTLNIPIGRIRKLNLADNVYSAFTVGDQLLWGAAEPLRRMLRILIARR
ncbi:MAG: aspartate-semialdehyde dehydrogenase [Proteobacteria bacterium]|nr:aspartate-semialdehyde dehydrogenase [Pseudomonadota bacterium]MDA1331705.1 aspartate-semialdehyde dehydrogenase [Pseudomonadota bacterium]